MIELLAAVTGASISVAAMALSGASKRSSENRDTVLRLTMAVESVASKMEELHIDFKSDRKEVFGRLNSMEQRIAKVEAKI